MNRRKRAPALLWGGALVTLLAVTAVAAPLLAPYDPAEQLDPPAGLYRPPGTVLAAVHLATGGWRLADRVRRTAGGLEIERLGLKETLAASEVVNLAAGGVADRRVFLLGSDKFGRDLASRMLYGMRISLAVGLLSVVLALTLGVIAGSAAATGGRLADALIMRGVDALMAFPFLFLIMAISAFLRPGPVLIVLILGATGWTTISRLIRAEILSLQKREFILAARSLGLSPFAILWRHLLPNAYTPAAIRATLQIAEMIILEASLSFLGLGLQPPIPSWGNMIAEGQEVLLQAWWVATFPGAALALTILAFNLLADGLQDTFDPRAATLPRL
ncbi:MAG TPA: ABC transporter permease [Thermoanaerobaculia bacterium]|nr:ABC transporter permease [Thermoanaerobaculia bacterium]